MFADFLPLLLFFLAYKVWGIFGATLAAMVTCLAQMAWHHYRGQRITTLQWITLGLVLLLGGATLFFQNELYIKWKPTAVYALFALALLSSPYWGNKEVLLKKMLGEKLNLPQNLWSRLNTAWALFFVTLGLLNGYVLTHFDTDTWVQFKLFGALGLTLVFSIIQGLCIAKYLK